MNDKTTQQQAARRARIQAGSRVEHSGKTYEIKDIIDIDKAMATDIETGRTELLPLAEVRLAEHQGNEAPHQPIDAMTEEEQRIAEQRLEAIRPLLELPEFGRKEVDNRAAEVGVSYGTLYRWLNRYRAYEDLTSLIPLKRGWRKGNTRIPTFAEDVMKDVIEKFYLTKLRPTAQKTVEKVQGDCRKKGIEPPAASTIRARLAKVDEEERLRRRGERQKARNRYKAAPGHFPNADFPLSVVQIDHTRGDVILVDDIDREPIGRPWVSMAMDVYSRAVTGYYLSFDAPSVTSVAMCVTHSILPKEDWLLRHEVEAEWPVWGKPEKFHVDNGPDFRAKDFQRSCAKHRIEVEYRPVKQPHFGGHIERLLGTMMRRLEGVPGCTFASVAQRGEHDPEKAAVLTKDEFEKWLLTLICKVYHERRHSALETTPLARWRQGLLGDRRTPGRGVLPRHRDPEGLVRDFLPRFERTVQRTGVKIEQLRYYGQPLQRWINAMNPERPKEKYKLTFRRDPRDISRLWFYDPDAKEYFRVPLADQSIPPMSIWEYRRARARLRDQGVDKPHGIQVADALNDMRTIEEQAQGKTKGAKRARRERQRRADHQRGITPATPMMSAKKEQETVPVRELSYETVEAFETIR